MVLRPYRYGFLLAGVLAALSGFGELEPPVLAATVMTKQDAKPSVVQPHAPDRQVSTAIPAVDSKQPVLAKRIPRKIHRHRKVAKKWLAPAVVEPKPGLSYHGILEQPQRYDPSIDRRAGRAPNPQAGEILHDHFQELDKNHDGMIDPFERTLGRLDMNRDVSNYQREYPPPRKTPLQGPANRPRKRAVATVSRAGSQTSWSACHALVQFRVVLNGKIPTPQYCGISRKYLSSPWSAS